jgi:hypothetical protein
MLDDAQRIQYRLIVSASDGLKYMLGLSLNAPVELGYSTTLVGKQKDQRPSPVSLEGVAM